MGKKKDSPEVTAAKLKVENLQLKEKIKKEESEKIALVLGLFMIIFFVALVAITLL